MSDGSLFGFRFKFYCISCENHDSFNPCKHEQENLNNVCKFFKKVER